MYNDVAKNIEDFVIKYPQTIVPNPVTKDYSVGYINRYFVRKTNDQNGSIFEVDRDVYTKYKENPFWKADTMRWRISGPINSTYNDDGTVDDPGVLSSNKASLSLISKKMKNIGLYLTNLNQFYK